MSILRVAKRILMSGMDSAGITRKVLNSAWRERRLLIICWHGVSNDDEHHWNPSLFMSTEILRMRLELLQEMKCSVLPLGEALARVRSATLPPRSVALTIDDGDSSFYLRTWPMLRSFGFPATLYWTTYYSIHPYAVFDPMLSYLLWKGRDRVLVLREPALRVDLGLPQERARAFDALYRFSRTSAWTAQRKELFLADLALLLKIDYSTIRSKRILHLISPAEARSMVAEGLDLQLHTHRHQVPRNSVEFKGELVENARAIRDAGAQTPSHFCYPSGSFVPEFAQWLRDNNIESASTCESGLVHPHTNRYFLPRMVDHEGIGPEEFRGWLSGIAAALLGKHRMDHHGFR